MGKRLFIVLKMIKKNVFRFLLLCVVLCLAMYVIVYLTAIQKAFATYTQAYQSTWGDRLCYEFTAFDSKRDLPEIRQNISSYAGVENVCEVYYLYASVEYQRLPVTFLFIDDSFWQNCSIVKMTENYSESGLSGGVPEVILCDPYGLLPEENFSLSCNEKDFAVHPVGEFQKPYLFPNLYLSGSGVSALERFLTGETAVVMKLSDETLKWASGISIGQYSDMGYVFFDNDASQDEINAVREFAFDNSIEIDQVEWTEENQTELKKTYFEAYFQLGLFIICITLLLLITYLVVFFKENMKEFTIMRTAAGSARQCRQIAWLLAVLPLLLSDIVGWIIFGVLSGLGRVPFFTAPVYIFSAAYFFVALLAVNALYCILTVVILCGLFRNSNVSDQKRRVFI